MPPFPKKPTTDLGLALQLGWLIALWMTLGVLAGKAFDNHFNSSPFGVLGGVFLAVLACGWNVYRAVKEIDEQESH